ncbi:hypothetical protein [Mangrovimonas xylaniphaga]|uniref:hypothetical protein n=1 Tax=Mangrovimonas xylaniphaga TaxID=1645915 RepID=UPI000A7AAFCC|nr:hypothetical protein [Mangrovimonas xylaniphaga]
MRMFIFIVLAAIVLLGCDIQGRLEIVNRTNSSVTFKYYERNEANTIDTIFMEVAPTGKGKFIYGFGWFWTKEQIQEYAQNISRIELISQSDTLFLNTKEAIGKFFIKNKKGLLNKRVKVVFK